MNLDKPSYITAIKSLVGGNIGGYDDGPIEKIKFFDGQIPPSESEIQAKLAELEAAEPMRLLRLERNQKLAETDWWAVADRTMTSEQTAYRTALRDLPANSPNVALDEQANLINVFWPTKPEA